MQSALCSAGHGTRTGYEAACRDGSDVRRHHSQQQGRPALHQAVGIRRPHHQYATCGRYRQCSCRYRRRSSVRTDLAIHLFRLLLEEHSAEHIYETLHLFGSGTAFFAVVTGVILWMAALAGGWFENLAVYYRFSDAVAQHPMGSRIGQSAMGKIARVLSRNLGGWSTSIVLGYLLGFTPVLGHFFGIPLDVRHVTLSTGTLALAAARFGFISLGRTWFYHAVAGIAVSSC